MLLLTTTDTWILKDTTFCNMFVTGFFLIGEPGEIERKKFQISLISLQYTNVAKSIASPYEYQRDI